MVHDFRDQLARLVLWLQWLQVLRISERDVLDRMEFEVGVYRLLDIAEIWVQTTEDMIMQDEHKREAQYHNPPEDVHCGRWSDE